MLQNKNVRNRTKTRRFRQKKTAKFGIILAIIRADMMTTPHLPAAMTEARKQKDCFFLVLPPFMRDERFNNDF